MRGARPCPALTSGSGKSLDAGRHRNRSLSRRPDYEDEACRGSVHAVYQRSRPDVILGLITTRPAEPQCPTDCQITEWKAAGLHAPSCFRLYLVTLLQSDVRVVGRL